MNGNVHRFAIAPIFVLFLIFSTACFSSKDGDSADEKDSTSTEGEDGGTVDRPDSGEDSDEGSEVEGGSGEAYDSGGSDGEDAPDSVRCEDDGYCYYPDGHFCDPWGMCCYPDGHCETEEDGAGGSPGGPFETIGPTEGSIIEPEDFTDDPWEPPIEDIGDSKFKLSEDPLCTELHHEAWTFSVWSDSRGVFVLTSGRKNGEYSYEYPEEDTPTPIFTGNGNCVGEGCIKSTIYFNDGKGWETYFEIENSMEDMPVELHLTGFPDGPLLLYGWYEYIKDDRYVSCGLSTIEDGDQKCEPIDWADHIFIINENLAYGIYNDNLIQYDGESWGPLPGVMSNSRMNNIWANETQIYGTLEGGMIIKHQDGVWEQLNTRTLQRFGPIWGFSETDIWAGTYEGGLFHYDGEEWKEISWKGDGCDNSSIDNMWGSDGILYFHTETTIARVVDGEVETLLAFPCIEWGMDEEVLQITSLWGNGPDEVFFTVRDENYPRRQCGINYLIQFDGEDFQQI